MTGFPWVPGRASWKARPSRGSSGGGGLRTLVKLPTIPLARGRSRRKGPASAPSDPTPPSQGPGPGSADALWLANTAVSLQKRVPKGDSYEGQMILLGKCWQPPRVWTRAGLCGQRGPGRCLPTALARRAMGLPAQRGSPHSVGPASPGTESVPCVLRCGPQSSGLCGPPPTPSSL